MKKYKDLSIKLKIPMMMGIGSVLVLAVVCLLLLRPLRTTSLADSSQIARLSAVEAGESLGERINGAAGVIRAYSGIIENLVQSDLIAKDIKRSYLLSGMNMLLRYEESIDNVWCIFEPQLFDGLDSLYAGRPGSTPEGAYVPWIVNNGRHVTDVSNRVESFLYDIPKKEGREIITEPYTIEIAGKMKQMFSICIPIRVHGQYIGVIGTDYDIAVLNTVVANLNGNWTGKMVTDRGTIAVHQLAERVGIQAENGDRTILNRLPEGRQFEGMFRFEGKDVFKVYVPVQLGVGNKPWFYAVDVPREEVYLHARSTASYLILYCLAGVLLIALAGWYLVRPLLNNVISVTGIIRKLSLGHINLNINKSTSRDEIGTMTGELEQLVDGLKRTASFAHNIGEGNLNAEYRLLSDGDALGTSLIEMRTSLQKADNEQTVRAKEEEQRNWVTAGLAKFAEILRRDNNDMEALSYNVISNMVKYMGINQGGIFILNDTENVLEMKACYAFDRRKFAEKTIRPGEGLVGTCLLEGEPIYMTEIPDEYISITSGLGNANPRALFISPLKVNEEIFGVIELASFTAFEPHQLDFVQKVSESIAATISSVTVNIRTNRLLEQTKLQAEEMANQEEELRQNMEEMQATQEESRRREIELQETLTKVQEVQAAGAEKEHEMNQFHDAIFDSNNVIEFNADGFIVDVNQNLLNLFGIDRSAFVGKHLTAFVSEQAFRKAEDAVDHGRVYEDVQEVTTPGGDRLTIRQRFIPLTDRNGRLQKVLMLGFDETMIEEIRQHEEELRQNMEEMQATQEEIRRREGELAAANYETEQLQNMILVTSQVATMSPDGIVLDVNDNIIRSFEGATRDTFVGQRMESFIGKKEMDAVMTHCTLGKMYEMVSNLPTGPNRTTTFRQKFVPICNKDGKLLRVMMVANDETYIEEMRHQEEILRQSMEELQATQEEMRRRETEISVLADRMGLILRESKIGTWEMNIVKGDPVNPNNKFMWSDELRRLLGYRDENDFPNVMNSWSDKLHPDDKQQTLDTFEKHIVDHTGKTPYDIVYRLLKKDGTYAYFHAFGVTIRDGEGYALRVAGAIQDVDEAHRREMELHDVLEKARKSEEEHREKANWYESMLDSFTGTPISATDNDRNLTFLNRPALQILGKTREEVIGKHCGNVWNVDICKDERCGIECLIHGRGKSKFSVGDRTFTTDGNYITDLSGKKIGHVEVVADITESEKLLAEAKNSEYEMQQFRGMIFENCNVVEFSAEGIVTDVNQNLLNVFGNVTKADLVGKSLTELTDAETFRKAWNDLKQGKVYETSHRIDIGTGKIITFRERFMPIRDKSGKLLHVFNLTDPEKE